MGQISFEQATGSMQNFPGNNRSSVGFFSLKNDGDEAVVRFMHDSTASFDIVAVHPVTIDGKYRKVNCIRDAKDPLDNCPFCNNNIKLENKFFIHLIQYDKDQNGNIVASPKIWERSLAYANTLANLINEYGPLSDHVFKIKRSGVAKSVDTTYQIMYASPQVYRPELYPKKENLFEGYKTIGTLIMDKSFEDLNTFIQTGSFPAGVANNIRQVTYPSPSYMTEGQVVAEAIPNTPIQNYNYPPQPETPRAVSPAPWEATTPINRPVRTY